jgi:hypothetical protein
MERLTDPVRLWNGHFDHSLNLRAGLLVQNQGVPAMSSRPLFKAILSCLMTVGIFSSAHALTQEELVAKLKSAGYSQVRDIKSSAEGTSVKATKNGKEVSLVVDSSGQIQEKR